MKTYSADTCEGQHSIQNEINQIIKHDYPKEWAKLIQDREFREQIRKQLRATGAEFCDYRAKECACDE